MYKRQLQDYCEDGEITVYEKKLLTGMSKVSITPYMEHIFAELQDFTPVSYTHLIRIISVLNAYYRRIMKIMRLACVLRVYYCLLYTSFEQAGNDNSVFRGQF